MNNSEMIEVFFEIDANNNGVITKKELMGYLQKRDYVDTDIKHFMYIYENSGDQMTFAEYCMKLGEDIEEYNYPEQHRDDMDIINSKMTTFHQEWIVTNIIRRAELKQNDNKAVAEYVKKAMDRQMEPVWHCIIVKGQYWACYSHELDDSIIIKYKGNVYIIFKTPDY